MSLPIYDSDLSFNTASQGDISYSIDRGQRPINEIDEKISEFEANKERYLADLNAQKQELNSIITRAPSTELKVYYFIGRLNPPHEGHIVTLKNLIQEAIRNNEADQQPYQIIILLGSGPNGGERTLNDPLPFDVKMKVVIHLLEKFGIPCQQMVNSGKIIIEEMEKAAGQIVSIIKKIVEINETIAEIHTTRFSGDKDEDVKKLAWIENSIQKSLVPLNVEVTTNVKGITALKNEDDEAEQSATQIRNDALISFILSKETGTGGFEKFNEKYNRLYGEDTREIYDSIIEQAKILDKEQIQEYIQNKTLPSSGKEKKQSKAKQKKGGRKTKRCKLTKKRKIPKRNKLTKKRKISKRKN
jgi:nicotinamide mononucleotide adenylyltransferase